MTLRQGPTDKVVPVYSCIEFVYDSIAFIGSYGQKSCIDIDISSAMIQGNFIRIAGIEFIASITPNNNGRLIALATGAGDQTTKLLETLSTNYIMCRDYDISQVNATRIRIKSKTMRDKNFDFDQSTDDPGVSFANIQTGLAIKKSANYRGIGVIEIWNRTKQEWVKMDEDVKNGRLKLDSNNQASHGEFRFRLDRWMRKYTKPIPPELALINPAEATEAVVAYRHGIADGGGGTFEINYFQTGDVKYFLNGAIRRENEDVGLKEYYDFNETERIKFLNQLPETLNLDCCSELFLSVLVEGSTKTWKLTQYLKLYFEDGTVKTVKYKDISGQGVTVIDFPSGPSNLGICDNRGEFVEFISNIINNGDFTSRDHWVATDEQPYSWSITPGSPGHATLDYDANAQPHTWQGMFNDMHLEHGVTYTYEFEVFDHIEGGMGFGWSNNFQFYTLDVVYANGIYTGTFTPNIANGGYIAFINLSCANGKMKIRNVKIRGEVDGLPVTTKVKCYGTYVEVETFDGGPTLPGEIPIGDSEEQDDGCITIMDMEAGISEYVNNGMTGVGHDPSQAYEGNYSLLNHLPAAGNPTSPWFGFWHNTQASLEPNQIYEVTIRMKTVDGLNLGVGPQDVTAEIGIKSGFTDSTIYGASKWDEGPINEWTKLTLLFGTGSSVDGRFGIIFDTPSGTANDPEVYWDSWEVCKYVVDPGENLFTDLRDNGDFYGSGILWASDLQNLGLVLNDDIYHSSGKEQSSMAFRIDDTGITAGVDFWLFSHLTPIIMEAGSTYVVGLTIMVEGGGVSYPETIKLGIQQGLSNAVITQSIVWNKGQDPYNEYFELIMVVQAGATESGNLSVIFNDLDGITPAMKAFRFHNWRVEKVSFNTNLFTDADNGNFESSVSGITTALTQYSQAHRSGGLAYQGNKYLEYVIEPGNNNLNGEFIFIGDTQIQIEEECVYLAKAGIYLNISDTDCLCDAGIPPTDTIYFRLCLLDDQYGIQEFISEWTTANCDPVASWFELQTIVRAQQTGAVKIGIKVGGSDGSTINKFTDGDGGTFEDDINNMVAGPGASSALIQDSGEGYGGKAALATEMPTAAITPTTEVQLLTHDTDIVLETGKRYIVSAKIRLANITDGPDNIWIQIASGFAGSTVSEVARIVNTSYANNTWAELSFVIEVGAGTTGKIEIVFSDVNGTITLSGQDVWVDNINVLEISAQTNTITNGDFEDGTIVIYSEGFSPSTGNSFDQDSLMTIETNALNAYEGTKYGQLAFPVGGIIAQQEILIGTYASEIQAGPKYVKISAYIKLDFPAAADCDCGDDNEFELEIRWGGQYKNQTATKKWDCTTDGYQAWTLLETWVELQDTPGSRDADLAIMVSDSNVAYQDLSTCFEGGNILIDKIEAIPYECVLPEINDCLEGSIILFDQISFKKAEQTDGPSIEPEDPVGPNTGNLTEEQKVCLHDCCEREMFIYRNELGRFDTLLTRKIDSISDNIEAQEYDEVITCDSTITEGGKTEVIKEAEEMNHVYTDFMTQEDTNQLRVFFNSIERYHIVDGEYRRIIIPKGEYPLYKKGGARFRTEFKFGYNYSYPTLRK